MAIAELLGSVPAVADIGCDHGKLSVYLRENGYEVVAADRSEKAATKARQAAMLARVSLDVRVGDGLSVLRKGEAQALVLAGLGGREILRILRDGIELARGFARIVLQPMQRQGELRQGLYESGFAILDETLVLDEGRIFELLLVSSGVPEPPPSGWPEGFYELGWQSVLRGGELIRALIARRKKEIERRVREAERGQKSAAADILQRRLECYINVERLAGAEFHPRP